MFKETMISYYGTVIPAREQKAKYLKCAQSGRVMHFVTELRVIIQTLMSTDFAPSPMDVVEHLINGFGSKTFSSEQAQMRVPPACNVEMLFPRFCISV